MATKKTTRRSEKTHPAAPTSRTTSKRGTRRQGPSIEPDAPGAAEPAVVVGTMQLADLVADPQNRRHHGARNLGMIIESLKTVGSARSIVIDENNVTLAGNGVASAAEAAGYKKIVTVDADGDTLVAVRRRGLTDEQKRLLAMYDNRAGELAEWNPEQLRADKAEGLDLKPFFSDTELDALTRSNGRNGPTAPLRDNPEYVIVVVCRDEAHQTELLEQFMEGGVECRAVVS